MPYSINRRYIPEIDQVRAYAALLVLFYHGFQLIGAQFAHGSSFDATKDWIIARNPLIAIVEEGHTGVGCFIVLSGFILSLGAVGNAIDYRPFLIARILRIYPLLLACLIGAIAIGPATASSIAISILPLNVAGGVDNSLTKMFWAVDIEFQCYLLFPFLIAFSNRLGSWLLVQMVLVALLLRTIAVLAGGAEPGFISYWTLLGRIDQFSIGMIAARLYVRGDLRELNPLWFGLALALVVGALYFFNRAGGFPLEGSWKLLWPTFEAAMWAFFIVTYIAAARLLPQLLAGLVTRIGEISYSIYLLHFAVITAVIRHGVYIRWTNNSYHDALLTTALVVMPASIAMAILTYNTIELPFLGLRPRYIRPET